MINLNKQWNRGIIIFTFLSILIIIIFIFFFIIKNIDNNINYNNNVNNILNKESNSIINEKEEIEENDNDNKEEEDISEVTNNNEIATKDIPVAIENKELENTEINTNVDINIDNNLIIDHKTLERENHSPEEINNWGTYTNNTYSFEIKYPGDWIMDNNQTNYLDWDHNFDSIDISHLQKKFFYEGYGYRTNYLIIDVYQNNNKSIKDIATQYFDIISKDDRYKIERIYTMLLNDMEFKSIDIVSLNEEISYNISLLIKGEFLYQITLEVDTPPGFSAKHQIHLLDLHKILSTFKFID